MSKGIENMRKYMKNVMKDTKNMINPHMLLTL